MAMQCFIDESADGCGNHTVVMAGYVADEETWANFNQDWNKELNRRNWDFVSFNSSIFERKKATKNAETFYRLIEKHLDKALCITCSISEYKDVLSRCRFPQSLENNKYYNLFQSEPNGMLYRAFMDFCYDEKGRLGISEPIDLIFDDSNKYRDWISNSFKYLYYSAEELGIDKKFFGKEPIFQDDEKTPALQAADLLARIIRHNIVKGNNPTDMPWKKLKEISHLITQMGEYYMFHVFDSSFSEDNSKIYKKYARARHYWLYNLFNRFFKRLPAFIRFPLLRIINKPFLLE